MKNLKNRIFKIVPVIAAIIMLASVSMAQTTKTTVKTKLTPKTTVADTLRKSNEIFIQNTSFVPSQLTVIKGTSVTWVNKEKNAYTVISEKLFNSGDIIYNGSFSYKFENVGTYVYHSASNTQISASVIVVDKLPLTTASAVKK